MLMTLNICKYIFTAFVLLYGLFIAYEDIKTKEIHAFPIEATNALALLLCLASQSSGMITAVGITVCVSFVLFVIFEKTHCWGSGDTKMYTQGVIFALLWLRPQTIIASVFVVLAYMFLASLIGLITALIKHDMRPPMGQAILLTNIITLVFTIFYF